MAETKIEWTATVLPDGTLLPGFTFNPWRGCAKVSTGCKMCYAETLSERNPKVLGIWGIHGTRPVASESYWRGPLKWNAEAEKSGIRRKVFCASLADVFEDREDLHPHRLRLLDLIRRTPNLDWLVLTKRPENILPALGEAKFRAVDETQAWLTAWLNGYEPDNVWLGTSVENQATADERIPHLLGVPAVVRFLSMEPLLGPVDLDYVTFDRWTVGSVLHGGANTTAPGTRGQMMPNAQVRTVDWVIVGGESGAKARPMHPAWARSLRDQCEATGVPFFFKQNGEWAPPDAVDAMTPHSQSVYFDGTRSVVHRYGKKVAGSLLDGREHKAWPEVRRV